MATKGKTAAAAKTAPAKTAAVGNFVEFLGYDAGVPEQEQLLTKAQAYEVIEVTEGGVVVKFTNPDFDSKKKVDAEKNPEFLETEVFNNECTLVDAPADAVAAPAAVVTKIKSGKTPKIPAAPAAKEKPAKVVKEKVVKPPKPPKVVVDKDALPVLSEEQEDADVLAIVNESEDLVATAQELEGNIGKNEYHLGGVLYHIKKSGSYKELNEAYKENAGFAAFTKDYLNVDYRKAMNLIDISVTFSQLGIENPAERVSQIGWTKASKITSPLREEGAVAEDLLKLAEENTSADLSIAIKEQTVNVGGTKGTPAKKVTIKLRYFEAEASSIMMAISTAKNQQALASDEDALSFIIDEWMQSHGGEAAVAEAPSQKAPGTAKPKASAKPAVKQAA
jgi:hypothetical protein